MYVGIKNFCSSYSIVNSFHRWGITKADLSSNLRSIALAEDGTVEAVAHLELPWFGVMWHPERDETQQDNNVELVKKVFLGLDQIAK